MELLFELLLEFYLKSEMALNNASGRANALNRTARYIPE